MNEFCEHGTTSRALSPAIRSGLDELLTGSRRRWRSDPSRGCSVRLHRSSTVRLALAGQRRVVGPRVPQRRPGISLYPGVGDALTALGPLLRPFISRWWTDKAAQLNPEVEEARSVLEFEDFLFGHDRVALERVAEGLLDLQHSTCFYCNSLVGRQREIDHFVPWSYSGDDGLDNLVAACRRCNNSKRATLAGPGHLAAQLHETSNGTETWTHSLASGGGHGTSRGPPHRPRRLPALARRTADLDPHSHRESLRDARARTAPS